MSRFAELERRLKQLTEPRTLHELHNIAGRAIVREVNRGFEREIAPDGTPWTPSQAAIREGRNTLRDSGALQDGISWLADSRKVVVRTTDRLGPVSRYASIHQEGASFTRSTSRRGSTSRAKTSTSVIVARPYLPVGTLPPRFERAVSNDIRAYLRQRFGR